MTQVDYEAAVTKLDEQKVAERARADEELAEALAAARRAYEAAESAARDKHGEALRASEEKFQAGEAAARQEHRPE